MTPTCPDESGREEAAVVTPDTTTADSPRPNPAAEELLARARSRHRQEVGEVVGEMRKQLAYGALRRVGSLAMDKFLDLISGQ